METLSYFIGSGFLLTTILIVLWVERVNRKTDEMYKYIESGDPIYLYFGESKELVYFIRIDEKGRIVYRMINGKIDRGFFPVIYPVISYNYKK